MNLTPTDKIYVVCTLTYTCLEIGGSDKMLHYIKKLRDENDMNYEVIDKCLELHLSHRGIGLFPEIRKMSYDKRRQLGLWLNEMINSDSTFQLDPMHEILIQLKFQSCDIPE